MPIHLYNTLTKKKEEFKPIQPGKVRMYVCGPTVYDYFHIGNGRTFIMSDIIRRYFEYRGYEVNYIMNLTDVDDRIIKKSNDLKVPPEKVSGEFTQAFFEDIERLSVRKATFYPKATENITEMIEIIKKLIEDGKAYILKNDVYYSIKKFPGYGKLSGKNIEELLAGARVNIDEEKQNPLDFALWKGAKEGEPYWESPWGKGRPGWHIECSAMSMKYLGETIDIHCGGNDLIFPHHENEIAQSEGFSGKPFSNYWIHFGFLNINEEKMSKSLGNFFTAREILEKYSGNIVKFYFLQTHYAAPLSFSEEGLEAAKHGLERIKNSLSEISRKIESKTEGKEEIDLDEYENKFTEALDDDFNTPKGLSVIFDLLKKVNSLFSENKNIGYINLINVRKFLENKISDVFGISLQEKQIPVNQEVIEGLIHERNKARSEKNWKRADEIRNELKNMGIILEDKKDGTTIWKVI